MTDLATHLERLGLEQYIDAFIEEGFDTWDTLCDVQEGDLEKLNVKLGHRRKLQRAIADYRGISYERLFGSPAQDTPSDSTRVTEGSQGIATGRDGGPAPPAEPKRKYRRHPKADDNAPDKPPSAYVLFSNKIREEVKADNLSFTEIAKLVGDRWQKLDPTQKEPFELQAASLKEQYGIQLSAYKKTDAFRDYSQYLSDFRAKHGAQQEPKRPKLDPQSSGGSLSAKSVEIADAIPAPTGHGRVGSIGSLSQSSYVSTVASPSNLLVQVPSMPNLASLSTRGVPPLHRATSPQSTQYSRSHPQDRRLMGQLSTQSSTSDDSAQVPFDPLSRTATLSLSTPPTGTPPLLPNTLGSARSEQSASGEGFPWPVRISQSAHPQGSVTPSGPSPLGSGITLPSPTFSNDPWRDRGMDWARPVQTPPATTATGTPGPVLPRPPILGPDRIAELSHNPAQRTLPPLPSALSLNSYQSTSSSAQLSRHASLDADRRYPTAYDGFERTTDRSDSEAANTLAGLSSNTGQDTPHARSHARRRP